MRFVRYQVKNGAPTQGWLLEDRVGVILGDIFNDYRRLEADIELSSVRLLSPIMPGKIIEVGQNYLERASEVGAQAPTIPMISLKPPSAVIGPMDSIIIPPQSSLVEHEAELAVVIGKRGRSIPSEQASGYIFGFTVGNDVTARDLQRKDVHKTRSKSFDTFCPLGPWIETDLDPTDLLITCRVNGELRQMASTRELVFSVNKLIAFVSSVMTLVPGDVILTGTPAGCSQIRSGDKVECAVEGIGSLENPVRNGY